MDTAKKKKKLIIIAAVIGLVAVMVAAGVVLAVIARNTETRANNFGFTKADILLEEPNWDSGKSHIVTPGSTETKDPQVRNTGEMPMYVYLEVKIPCAFMKTVNSDKSLGVEEATDLLEFSADKDWVLVYDDEKKAVSEAETGYHTVVYAYTQPLAKNSATPALFKEVKYADVIEGYPSGDPGIDMPISAFALQTESVDSEDGADIEEKLKSAYLKMIARGTEETTVGTASQEVLGS